MNSEFALEELEVEFLEARHEMATVSAPPSMCYPNPLPREIIAKVVGLIPPSYCAV